jgi:hypothetical protein
LRRLPDILLDGRNRLLRFMRTLVVNISAERLGEPAAIIGEDLVVGGSSRDHEVGHPIIDLIFCWQIGVNVDQDAFRP